MQYTGLFSFLIRLKKNQVKVSKKIGIDQELIQSNPNPTLKTKSD